MNELMINVSSDGGVIIDNQVKQRSLKWIKENLAHLIFQVIQFSHDGLSVAPAPQMRASCPALYKLFRVRQEQKNTEEVKPHPSLAKLFSPQKFHKIRFLTNELPMLIPSVPWMSTTQGGFLLDNTRFGCLLYWNSINCTPVKITLKISVLWGPQTIFITPQWNLQNLMHAYKQLIQYLTV